MDHLKQKFNHIYIHYGGRFDVKSSDLNEDEKQLLKEIIDQLNWNLKNGFIRNIIPEASEIYVDYINSTSHNAFANSRDLKTIGINYGLALHLIRVAGLLLGNTKLFDALEEDDELHELEKLLPLFKDTFIRNDTIPYRKNPLNKERTEVATIVATIALYFVVGHEIAHVLKHDKIIASLRNTNKISEFYDNSFAENQDIFTMKTLEIDADINGALVSFWMSITLYEDKNLPLYSNYAGPGYIWLLAVLTFLYSIEKIAGDYYPDKVSYHPNVFIRQNFCIQHIRQILKDKEFISFACKEDYGPDFELTLRRKLKELELFFGKQYLIDKFESRQDASMLREEFHLLSQNLIKINTQFS